MKLWKHRRKLTYLNGLLLRNPILTTGCFVAPAAIVTTGLRPALALTMMIALVSIPSYVIMGFFGKKIPPMFRMLCSPLLASLLYIPAYFLTELAFQQLNERLGFYLPVLVMDFFFTTRCTGMAQRTKPHWMLLDAFCCCIGSGIVLCLIGLLREYLATGTVWGNAVQTLQTAPAMLLPFAGILVLAFFAAAAQGLNHWLRKTLRRSWKYYLMEEAQKND